MYVCMYVCMRKNFSKEFFLRSKLEKDSNI